MSAAVPNPSCGRCHMTASQVGRALMKCGGCRAMLYCSRECQRTDWRAHKPYCQSQSQSQSQPAAAQLPPRNRTTFRMNLSDFLGGSTPNPNDQSTSSAQNTNANTIYYLRISVAHLHNIRFAGPFPTLDQVYLQARHNFGADCQPGRRVLDNLLQNGHLVTGFEHISSPINGDPNKTRRIELLRRTDASLAPKLPCPVWSIIVSEPLQVSVQAALRQSDGEMPLKSMDVRGSFDNEHDAREAARVVLEDLARSSSDFSCHTAPPPSPAIGVVVERRSRLIKWMVSLSYDDATIALDDD